MPNTRPPHPYLTREETNDILETLNFPFRDANLVASDPLTLKKVAALEKLIAGAICEWAGLELEAQQSWASLDNQLQEWTEEYLFG